MGLVRQASTEVAEPYFERLSMQRQTLSWVFLGVVLGLAACDRSPTSPTAPATVSIDSTTQAAVTATVGQVLSQTAASGSTVTLSLPPPPVISTPCPSGGSITTTFALPEPIGDRASGSPLTSFTLTSRTDFNDCRSQNVTMRGDPALVHSSKFETSGTGPGTPTSMTATMQTKEAIVAVSNGVESRVRYDCSSVMVLQIGSTSLPQIASTGTITWESPLGTVVRTTGCGPA